MGIKLDSFLEEVIDHYTPAHQLGVAIEEMSELTKEICKYKRGFENRTSIVEEMADVYIMLRQLKLIFNVGEDEIKAVEKAKIKRLMEYMKDDDNE